jgi:hypothetical protein
LLGLWCSNAHLKSSWNGYLLLRYVEQVTLRVMQEDALEFIQAVEAEHNNNDNAMEDQ